MIGENKAVWLALAAVVLILGGWWWYGWFTGAERQIAKQLGEIQKLISKAPGEDNLKALAKARAATALFAENFEFEAPQFEFHTRDRQQLISGIHQYRSRAETILMQFPERDLVVDTEQHRATSHVTAQLITQARDLTGREAYRFQINWLDQDGQWRIDYVRLLEVIEEPPRSWIP
jgi:hypothetical protein